MLEPRAPQPALHWRPLNNCGCGFRVRVCVALLPGLRMGEGDLEAVGAAAHEAGAQWFTSGVLFFDAVVFESVQCLSAGEIPPIWPKSTGRGMRRIRMRRRISEESRGNAFDGAREVRVRCAARDAMKRPVGRVSQLKLELGVWRKAADLWRSSLHSRLNGGFRPPTALRHDDAGLFAL